MTTTLTSSSQIVATVSTFFTWIATLCRRGARYHGREEDLRHDLGEHPDYDRAWVLLSRDSRYFGAMGSAEYKSRYPLLKEAAEGLRRGYFVNHKEALRDQLLAFKAQAWKTETMQVLGPPCSEPKPRVSSGCGRRSVGGKTKCTGC